MIALRLLLLALAFGPSLAFAAQASIVPPPLTGAASDFSRLMGQAANLGDVEISDAVTGKVGGRDVAMVSKRTVPWTAVAKAVGKAAPIVGTAVAVAEIWDSMRAKPDGSGGIKWDAGTGQTMQQRWCGISKTGNYEICMASASSALSAITKTYAPIITNSGPVYVQMSTVFQGPTTWSANAYWVHPANGAITTVSGPSVDLKEVMACPDSVDASDPDYSSMMGLPGPDGQCGTGRYNEKLTEDELGKKVQQHGNKAKAQDLARDLMEKGGVDFTPDATPVNGTLSGPATAPGPTTTTTTQGPAGTVTKTENTTYNITYNSNTYNYTTVVTTTTTDGNGGTSTETEETESDAPVEDDEAAPPQDPSMPNLPKLYERKYPDGVFGVWQGASDGLQQTPVMTFLRQLVPTNLGDGGCPVWTMPVMYGINNIQNADLSVPCWLWSVLRSIMLITALLAARRIIFGG